MKSNYSKPNALTYKVGKAVAYIYNSFLIKNKYVRNELKHAKGPAVVLGTHMSKYDQFLTSCATKRRITFMIGDAIYYSLSFGWFVKSMKPIHKMQFRTTINDMTNCAAVTKAGEILCLFPAGVCTLCGSNPYLPSATGKFLKFLKSDVYVARLNGAYLTNPKWSKVIRKGQIHTDVYKLFSSQDLKEMSAEDIYEKASKALSFDEYEWQEQVKIPFKNGNCIEGLENILCTCPVCKKHYSIMTKDTDTIYCTECGFTQRADEYGFLHCESDPSKEIRHPSDWIKILHGDLKASIVASDSFEKTFTCLIKRLNIQKHRFDEMGTATVLITKERIITTLEDGSVLLDETSDSYPYPPMIPGEYFDLQSSEEILRCYPQNPKDVTYFCEIASCMFELSNQFKEKSKKVE